MSKTIGIARAHTNIALIKYWGKRDKEQFLPMNSSLSLTLDAFYTDTKVVFDDSLTADEFYLNGQKQSEKEIQKISHFLNLFREQIDKGRFARVDSLNFVPTAAGLASSASAFAALALATATALRLEMSKEELSTYARRGSGSSTRSLFGGFVEWEMGDDQTNSMAHPVDDASWDIGMIVLAVDTGKKKIASREGMEHTVQTSPFYPIWVETAAHDLKEMKTAIKKRDFDRIGQLAEHNGMKMHATTLSANPPFTYWTADTMKAQEAVRQVREQLGVKAFMTIDAGPNVKVLCRASDMETLVAALSDYLPRNQIWTSLPGRGAYVLTESEWLISQERFLEGD